MPGLVLEGGTFRTLFSCGVLDALLDEKIYFPYTVAVSAGAGYGISYHSMQKGRTNEIMKRFRNDKRYIGVRNFLKCRSLFGLDFAFTEVPNRYVPFDMETFKKNPCKLFCTVTNAHTGKAEYLDGALMDRDFTLLRATCAIPLVFPAIEIGGNKYYDGGLADPIPVRESMAQGHEKNLIILTRPKGYVKQEEKLTDFTRFVLAKKYPALCEVLARRPEIYNDEVALCEQLEREGKAVVLRPEYPIKSFEKDVDALLAASRHGYETAQKNMQRIKALF